MKLAAVIKMLLDGGYGNKPDPQAILLDYVNGDLLPICQWDVDLKRKRVCPFADSRGGRYTVTAAAEWMASRPDLADFDLFGHTPDSPDAQPATWYMACDDYDGTPAIAFQCEAIEAVDEGPDEKQMEFDK